MEGNVSKVTFVQKALLSKRRAPQACTVAMWGSRTRVGCVILGSIVRSPGVALRGQTVRRWVGGRAQQGSFVRRGQSGLSDAPKRHIRRSLGTLLYTIVTLVLQAGIVLRKVCPTEPNSLVTLAISVLRECLTAAHPKIYARSGMSARGTIFLQPPV